MKRRAKGHLGSRERRRLVQALIRRDGLKCYHCRGDIDLGAPRNSNAQLALRRVVPRLEGGTNALENLRLTHHGCDWAAGGKITPAAVAKSRAEAAA